LALTTAMTRTRANSEQASDDGGARVRERE